MKLSVFFVTKFNNFSTQKWTNIYALTNTYFLYLYIKSQPLSDWPYLVN